MILFYIALRDNTDVYTASISQGLPFTIFLYIKQIQIYHPSPSYTLQMIYYLIGTVIYINYTQNKLPYLLY